MASETLTDYERRRLENIKRNDEVMAALKVHTKAQILSASSKHLRETKSYKTSPHKKPKTQTPIVIRRSLRTRRMPPDGVESLIKALDSGSSPKSPKPSPRDLGPIGMRHVYSGDSSDRGLIDTIMGVSRKKSELCGVKRENEGFDCEVKKEKEGFGCKVKVEENGVLDSVGVCGVKRENEGFGCEVKVEGNGFLGSFDLETLMLEQENVARVVPGKITNVRFFPSAELELIVVGNKYGDVGFWNADPKKEGDDIYLYQPHPAPISGISIHPFSLSKVFTSCYDGFIRMMDVEKEVFDLVYSSEYTIFTLSQRPDDEKSLYFGEASGGLNIWDYRAGQSSSLLSLHYDRINTIDFNSGNTNIMATSSTDGTACIWDLRSMNGSKPKALKAVRHKKSVHSAYFSPSGRSLATTSPDNRVGLLSGINFEDSSMIYHDNQTSRWIASFRAIWGWDDSYIFMGNNRRGVDIISTAQRKQIKTLESPYMTAIPCRFASHPLNIGRLAGTTAGGQVYMWTSH